MPNVKTVQDRNKGALLILDDGVKVWTPDRELARTLLGKPIPEDWTRRENENGPMALPPKPRGGGIAAAWRNTKEGFEAEAAGRRRWQEIEEDRKDRRTALMTAAEKLPNGAMDAEYERKFTRMFDFMYELLRPSPAAGPAVSTKPAGVTVGDSTSGPEAGGDSALVGSSSAQDPGPGTSSRAKAPVESATEYVGTGVSSPLARGTTSADGEAAGTEPGEGKSGEHIASPGSTTCTHRGASGRWLPTNQKDGVPVCPRCGMSAILYKESV